MKITVQKIWETEEEIEAPDGLSHEDLVQWVGERCGTVANNQLESEWVATHCLDENGDLFKTFD